MSQNHNTKNLSKLICIMVTIYIKIGYPTILSELFRLSRISNNLFQGISDFFAVNF